MTENQISDYWSQDIVQRLMQRAEVARGEGTGTGISDATHFLQAAEEITRLRSEAQITSPCAWQWRFKLQDGSWSDWNDGKVRHWVVEDKKEYEERELYALSLGEAKSEEPK